MYQKMSPTFIKLSATYIIRYFKTIMLLGKGFISNFLAILISLNILLFERIGHRSMGVRG